MRVLIIGATGLLGKALLGEWDLDEVTGTNSHNADIREPAQLRALFARVRPEWTFAPTTMALASSRRNLSP
jgi:dTDP-4-dehydrorhamnose reductase